MSGRKILCTILGSLMLGACGTGQAVVTIELENADADGATVVQPQANLIVQLLPYDRDPVFDSLARAASQPEPPIPEELLLAQEAVAAAQEEWRAAETEWLGMRDQLQSISDEIETLNRGEARYRLLFRDFQDIDGRVGAAERRTDQAFDRFNELQSGTIAQTEEVRLLREQWADEAFADVGDVISLRMELSGRDVVVDTTDVNGMVTIDAEPGEWWVYARTDLSYTQLYWNIAITLVRGEPLSLRLNAGNAVVRPKL